MRFPSNTLKMSSNEREEDTSILYLFLFFDSLSLTLNYLLFLFKSIENVNKCITVVKCDFNRYRINI